MSIPTVHVKPLLSGVYTVTCAWCQKKSTSVHGPAERNSKRMNCCHCGKPLRVVFGQAEAATTEPPEVDENAKAQAFLDRLRAADKVNN